MTAPTEGDVGARPMPAGKVPAALLAELLAGLPPHPPEVRLGPAVGEDACAIDVPAGTIVAATDPITLTGEQLGRFAVLVNANDVAVMGVRPRWFLATVLFPPGSSASQVRKLFGTIRRSLDDIGAHLVGGHTEVTDAVNRPVVVGQMLGLAENGRYVSTGGVRPGDVVLQVGPVPVEGAAVLATEAADRLGQLDPAVLQAARSALSDPGISVVEAALLAAGDGTVAMHDPTEGGLAAGLHELAAASGVGLVVDRHAVLWFDPGTAVCDALGADPWATLASGCLLAAFPPQRAARALEALTRHWPAAIIARARPGSGVHDQTGSTIPWPERDDVSRLLSS
jgi:hydrogenase maturation factor